MAKLIGATLLLIILVDCFSDKTAYCDEFHSAGISRADIRKCRCSVSGSVNRKRCPIPLIPTTETEKLSLKNCLCCKTISKNSRTPSMNRFCDLPCYSSRVATPL